MVLLPGDALSPSGTQFRAPFPHLREVQIRRTQQKLCLVNALEAPQICLDEAPKTLLQ